MRWYIFFIILVASLVSPAESSNKIRLNYGVIFKEETKVQFSNEMWLHTFAVDIPKSMALESANECFNCTQFNKVVQTMNQIKIRCQARLNATIEELYTLIPQIRQDRKSGKSPRALLGFVGTIYKSVFGLATVEDVNVLAQHINRVTSTVNKVTEALAQHGKHLSSFTATVTRRLDNMVLGVKQNHDALISLSNSLRKDITLLNDAIDTVSTFLINQLNDAETLESQLEQFKLGVETLVQGKLSPILIKPALLQKSLREIQGILSKNYRRTYISSTDPQVHYAHSKFFFARHRSTLFITLKIPLSTFRLPFTLYKVVSLPVPINSSSNHATELLNLPDYIAISNKADYFTEVSKSMIDTCAGDTLKHCLLTKALTATTYNDSCLISLFNNNIETINKTCNFRFVQERLSPRFIELDTSSIIVYNVPEIIYNCKHKVANITGCKFCLVKLPCYCSLTYSNLYFPARLTACNSRPKLKPTYFHPVNLALLQQFFNASSIKSISGYTMFPEEVIIDIPAFQIYNHSMSNIFAKDQKEHLNLKKMVKAVKQDSVIFQSLAEPLANGDLTVPTSIFDTFNILTIVSLCLSICSFVGIVYIVYKFRALSAALLLTKATSVKSSAVPVFRYIRPDNTLQDDATSTDISDILSWDHGIFLLVSISTLFIVIMVIKYLRKHRHNCKIVLEVTTGSLCAMVPITFLSLCPSYWEITPPSDIENIQISGYFRPMLTLQWDNLAIKNKLSEKQIEVKSTISLSYWQAYKLRKILNQPFCAYLILIHDNYYYALSD